MLGKRVAQFPIAEDTIRLVPKKTTFEAQDKQ
jgi:hypothetical protein